MKIDNGLVEEYLERLLVLKRESRTVTYNEIGGEFGTFYRHVQRFLAPIHGSIDVYNRVHGGDVPHITALVVNGKTKKPGVGCRTQSPLRVFNYDYSRCVNEVKTILRFYLSKYDLYDGGYDEYVKHISNLYKALTPEYKKQLLSAPTGYRKSSVRAAARVRRRLIDVNQG